jgi:hypothetical protein
MNISDGLYSRSDKDAHEVNMSPDESSLLVRYSYKNKRGNYLLVKTKTTLRQIEFYNRSIQSL